jgi:hypothetical protein
LFLVLLFLAVLWAAVAASFLRERIGSASGDSVGSFRRQLHVLQRTGPQTVSPAHPLYISSAPSLGLGLGAPAGAVPVGLRRARTLKRRRDVLFSLLGAMGVTLALGALPALRPLWGLHVLLDLMFAGYVVALVRLRNIAAERDMKLRFLPGGARPEPALALRRSAN